MNTSTSIGSTSFEKIDDSVDSNIVDNSADDWDTPPLTVVEYSIDDAGTSTTAATARNRDDGSQEASSFVLLAQDATSPDDVETDFGETRLRSMDSSTQHFSRATRNGKASASCQSDSSRDEGSNVEHFSTDDLSSYTMAKVHGSESVADYSSISGFSVITLGGSSHITCRKCSFLNEPNASVCHMCQVTLGSNPNLEIDIQIAHNLQRKEEQESERRLLQMEEERKALATKSAYEQAIVLQNEIFSFFSHATIRSLTAPDIERPTPTRSENAIQLLPYGAFHFQVMQFISSVRSNSEHFSIVLGYHFSDKSVQKQVQLEGFGSSIVLNSNDVEAAFRHPGSQLKTSDNPEEEGSASHEEYQLLGWIVAYVEERGSDCRYDLVTYENQETKEAIMATVYTTRPILPIVSFDPSQRMSKTVQHVMQGLSRILKDFLIPEEADLVVRVDEPASKNIGNNPVP